MSGKNGFIKVLTIFFTAFFLCTCGLDTFYYVDSPVSDGHIAVYNSDDSLQNYFSCRTTEESPSENQFMFGSSECAFLGTEIYYKIYNNYSTMISTESSVDNMSSDSSSSSSSASYLIDTKGYKPLKLSSGSVFPLIKAGNSPQNRFVYIKLMDNEPICLSTSVMNSYTSGNELLVDGNMVYPRRYIDSSKGFEFGKDDYNPLPARTDEDVTWTETASEDGVWYVDMYAVSMARDVNYALQYSRPYRMGSISIRVE
ncbi:MAG: hypothetical protein J5857_03305 [Treponema sp.]|nr:hypothetical protein [Treponema sp.]